MYFITFFFVLYVTFCWTFTVRNNVSHIMHSCVLNAGPVAVFWKLPYTRPPSRTEFVSPKRISARTCPSCASMTEGPKTQNKIFNIWRWKAKRKIFPSSIWKGGVVKEKSVEKETKHGWTAPWHHKTNHNRRRGG